MFSIPRATSPAASASTLPCSAVSSRASSSVCVSTRFRKAYISFVRTASEVRRQPLNASLAAATAASTSAVLARPTAAVCSPVAGLKTAWVLPDSGSMWFPLT